MREMFAETADRLLGDLCTPSLVRQAEAGQWPAEFWVQLEETGLPLALAAEDVGGVGAGWREALPILLGCGRQAVPVPLAETLGAQALARLAGVQLPQGRITLAELEADQHGEVRAHNVSFADRTEFVVGSLPGDRAEELLVLRVADARSAEGAVLSRDGRRNLSWRDGNSVLRAPLPEGQSARLAGAAIRSAQLAGAIQKILHMAVTYADERKQFGKTLSKFQALQQQLAMLGQLAVSTAMAAELACGSGDAALDGQRVAFAKAVTSEAGQRAAMIAHALHGAIGTTAEYDLQLFTRRIWAWRLDFGSETYWNAWVGRALRDGNDAPWDYIVRATREAQSA